MIREEAAKKDSFALTLLAFSSYAWAEKGAGDRNMRLERAAKASDKLSMAIYGEMMYSGRNIEKDTVEGLRYILDSASAENYFAYKTLINIGHDSDVYCGYLKDGLNKFGIDLFSEPIITAPEILFQLQTNCSLFKTGKVTKTDVSEKVLKSSSDQTADFIKAVGLFKNKRYNDALKGFYELRMSTDTTVAVNARYCIGVMYEKGLGTDKDRKKADIYLGSALADGQILYGTALGEANFPATDKIINLTASLYCAE